LPKSSRTTHCESPPPATNGALLSRVFPSILTTHNAAHHHCPTLPLKPFPRYYTAPSLSGRAHCITPSLLDIRSGLLNAGYKVSSSHADKDALKTDAPSSAVWDMMRAWVKLHPVKNLPADSPATRLLAIEPKVAYSFEVHPEANPKSRAAGINRFQQNPLPNWGPKARAKRRKPTDDATDATATLEAASEADSASKKLKADQPPT
jgi:hypothetical protein